MTMAMSWDQLKAMTDDELVATFDSIANDTIIGLNFLYDELNRRSLARSTAAALNEARQARRLAIANAIVAVVAVTIAVLTLLLAGGPGAPTVRSCLVISAAAGADPEPALCLAEEP